ncbi:MAG: type II toxin-antitoxin system VapC family toxin [Candidatus Aenigmarchaeota archaeon]|nr:type II toxin-antitoxin system VapC family toxin [Candidatus Aenigmarchaeota archaeon]MDI6722086.1 type II toxin-antitoxin system VapC family toxin [Candidatus Aenigmarchaeota archaeon]
MVVLDTDILIGILREDHEAVDFLDALESSGEKLNITVVNAYELYEGALIHPKKEETIKKVETLIMSFECLNFTHPASPIAAGISAELRKKGGMIDLEDIYIASIAKLNDEDIVTRNEKHFSRIKGINVRKW